MQRSSYLRGLQEAILAVHGVNSRHTGSTPVKDVFHGETAWEGEVEAFDLIDHPKAKRAYAWAYDDNGTLRTTAVLELPPVDFADNGGAGGDCGESQGEKVKFAPREGKKLGRRIPTPVEQWGCFYSTFATVIVVSAGFVIFCILFLLWRWGCFPKISFPN